MLAPFPRLELQSFSGLLGFFPLPRLAQSNASAPCPCWPAQGRACSVQSHPRFPAATGRLPLFFSCAQCVVCFVMNFKWQWTPVDLCSGMCVECHHAGCQLPSCFVSSVCGCKGVMEGGPGRAFVRKRPRTFKSFMAYNWVKDCFFCYLFFSNQCSSA